MTLERFLSATIDWRGIFACAKSAGVAVAVELPPAGSKADTFSAPLLHVGTSRVTFAGDTTKYLPDDPVVTLDYAYIRGFWYHRNGTFTVYATRLHGHRETLPEPYM